MTITLPLLLFYFSSLICLIANLFYRKKLNLEVSFLFFTNVFDKIFVSLLHPRLFSSSEMSVSTMSVLSVIVIFSGNWQGAEIRLILTWFNVSFCAEFLFFPGNPFCEVEHVSNPYLFKMVQSMQFNVSLFTILLFVTATSSCKIK